MTDSVQNVTQRMAVMALDAFSARHRVIANNIANIDTTNYRPLQLNFEAQLANLQSAARSGAPDSELARLTDQVKPFAEPRGEPSFQSADTSTRLDEEMVALVQNTMNYESVVTALEREGQLTRLALGAST